MFLYILFTKTRDEKKPMDPHESVVNYRSLQTAKNRKRDAKKCCVSKVEHRLKEAIHPRLRDEIIYGVEEDVGCC